MLSLSIRVCRMVFNSLKLMQMWNQALTLPPGHGIPWLWAMMETQMRKGSLSGLDLLEGPR